MKTLIKSLIAASFAVSSFSASALTQTIGVNTGAGVAYDVFNVQCPANTTFFVANVKDLPPVKTPVISTALVAIDSNPAIAPQWGNWTTDTTEDANYSQSISFLASYNPAKINRVYVAKSANTSGNPANNGYEAYDVQVQCFVMFQGYKNATLTLQAVNQ